MATFLDLVNKVVYESGSEMDPLSVSSWSSAEAGRRNYPRFKRNVVDAWNMIQMRRLQWEFNDIAMDVVVNPRLYVVNGSRVSAPPIGTIFQGVDSGFRFVLSKVILVDGAWEDGDAKAQLEFVDYSVSDRPIMGEVFKEISPVADDAVFTYLRRGSYDFKEYNSLMREIQWDSMVVQLENYSPLPVVFLPWNNWLYQDSDYGGVSTSTPVYISQDYKGDVVFYPQSLRPFRASFVASTAPQTLSNPLDVPAVIPEEFHEWIAWEALDNVAYFDKNPDLQAYAQKWTKFYRIRAETMLMPIPSWGPNRYSNFGWRTGVL